jgi:hypothetical protein
LVCQNEKNYKLKHSDDRFNDLENRLKKELENMASIINGVADQEAAAAATTTFTLNSQVKLIVVVI